MRSPQPLRNGGDNSCSPSHNRRFQSTVAEHKLRRFNSLILVFRLVSFSFSLASSVFVLTNTRGSDTPHWYHYDTFRFVLAANAIVAVYSVFEMGASVWEISRGVTLFPEVLQIWFDFGHDQVFAYLLLSANAAGTTMARTLKEMDTCRASNAFCVQMDIAIALGYVAFVFLGLTSLLTGFRVVCFIINGSRFHL
ncbi:CASP-like protein 4C2 [Vigna radiata var. radiata]|uniref:CASP-like protein n=1 Tax=Vigna radiata var. radiata TaxID=3916 RepID=A0A1S3V3G2_VIGRR|nr:CASP-like protein 4C2 [Vigna radiata var. radiata]